MTESTEDRRRRPQWGVGLRITGHALLVTSIGLSLSLFIYAFASPTHLVDVGLLTGVTIIFAFIVDIRPSHALMALGNCGDRQADRCSANRRTEHAE